MTYGITRYASPLGKDLSGTSVNAPGELRFMVSKLQPGDTLLLLDGQYDLVNTVVVSVNATADKWVVICAAKGARPVLDFRQQQINMNGMKVSGSHILIKDLTIRYAGKKGVWLENASYCRLEGLDVYGCCDSGIQLRKGGHNLVINCDSHDTLIIRQTAVMPMALRISRVEVPLRAILILVAEHGITQTTDGILFSVIRRMVCQPCTCSA
ncbi:right-handed parallel beta-helix repeat-containing protein [uncultured Prevotella sp.]|uniref:right-handed parallel beta-helix repeat-containing protein n=1 Tax=uncultured Prevotella sp. TaxID=159272 RepID=UPI002584CDCE|nr:right-handed parallel beta-helix repeat-containing protein [uncultured Prevotella sp.]